MAPYMLSLSTEQWDTVLRSVSHDLRTPLTTLQGFSDLSLRVAKEDREKKLALAAIRSVMDTDLFLTLLSFHYKGFVPQFEEGNIEDIFVQALSWIQTQYPERTITYKGNVKGALCIFDKKRVFQACISLFLEVIYRTPHTHPLIIESFTRASCVYLSFHTSIKHVEYKEKEDPYKKATFRSIFASEVLKIHRAQLQWTSKDDQSLPQICFPIAIVT